MYCKLKSDRLIDSVDFPCDLKKFSIEELKIIADELRSDIISIISGVGGHLGAGLGVVELTVALHHVFDTPRDQLVWDIGHQAYPHKYLTGRKELLHTIRQGGGLSGFLKRSESEYDVFGAGHSSTSISAALGIAVARDQLQEDFNVVCVIGDGALTAGMVYEAMNNAGHEKSRMIVILNDNDMSIAPNVGAMQKYLNRLTSSKAFLNIRAHAKSFVNNLPTPIELLTKKAKKYTKDLVQGGNFFEEIGFHYVGPVDGHDLNELVPILRNLRDDKNIESPILLHVKTQKGRGFESPVSCSEMYHAVSKFDLETKIQEKPLTKNKTFTKVFGETLCALAKEDDKILAITAAMPSGTGLNIFAKEFPDRSFDVGIAEQHAVTFAAGLATQGIKPFCAIYSTFLQRAYDQVVHDVAIQCLPVRFAIDRAGLVGGDGPTHAGSFDIGYLASLPNMVVMAASDEAELARMIATAAAIDDRPSAFRYPRGEGSGAAIPEVLEPLEIGKARVVTQGSKVAIVSLGARLQEVMKAAEMLEAELGFRPTIVDARFAKPIDADLILQLAGEHQVLITIEEGAIGGFAAQVSNLLSESGMLDDGKLKFRAMFLPDFFIEHNSPAKMYAEAGLNAEDICNKIKKLIH